MHDETLPDRPTVHLLHDEKSGLDGVIVLHSTALGPAAGGCRLWRYDGRDQMVADAERLAAGMSYKNAMADLPLGGGKAVLQRPAGDFDRADLFRAFGRAVNALCGSYVTAEDVGTSEHDMSVVREATRHVAGLPRATDAPGGDPSPWTARGVFVAMEHAVAHHLDRPLGDCTVAIQGVGNVGAHLARQLRAAGARLLIADVDSATAARVAVETGAQVCGVEQIAHAKADVFAPCALGGALNAATIPALAARVVCGAANNQLATRADAGALAARGILYAPDYVVNAGGIINVAAEYLGWAPHEVEARVERTAQRLSGVFARAEELGVTPAEAADQLAQERIARAAHPHGLAA